MASIFLSHSSVDKEFVRDLHIFLEENGVKCWIDEAEIMIGDSLIKKIDEGIKMADYVAIILSPNSMKSNWVEKELEIAITKEIESGKTQVLPILIENCEIPGYLKGKRFGDFRTTSKSISGMRDLLKVLKGKETKIDKKMNLPSNNKKDSEKEYKRFLEMYDELTYAEPFASPKFNNHQAKKLAEIFCQDEAFKKFKTFLKMYDELTYAEPFASPRFTKEDAIDITFKRLSLQKPQLVYFGN